MSFNINKVNPYIRTAIHSVISADAPIKRRIIFDYELIYLNEGQFTFTYNDIPYKCKKGCFIFIRPAIPHSFTNIKGYISQPHIHFDIAYSWLSPKIPISFKDYCDLTDEEKGYIADDIFEGYPLSPFIEFSDKSAALELFYNIIDAPADTLKRKAMLIELIEMLIADNFPDCLHTKENTSNAIKQIKDYIDAGQGLSVKLDDLEKQFSYSKFHLERQFKNQYGISLMAYRNNKRMDFARKLLEEKNVSSVSQELGFTSIYVFSRAFKQHFGFSPKEYKNKR
ncbi:MAG: helix-turn-helix transcriptional regulator [Clostridia bacterium]|nr:helix-turn-helix transcriptional regulator [Clostridia bacterium]